jgi:hypothetical protein
MNTDEVSKLLTIEEIKKLRVLYSHYLDGNDMESLAGLFTTDAVCQTEGEPWRGREEIKKALSAAFTEYDQQKLGSYPFLHPVTNQWIELIDEDTAQGRCYLIDFFTQRAAAENPLLLVGIYADEYKKLEGKWYISRSRLDLVWPKRNGGGGYPGNGLVLPE